RAETHGHVRRSRRCGRGKDLPRRAARRFPDPADEARTAALAHQALPARDVFPQARRNRAQWRQAEMSRLMIYGANGYTGKLIAREAAKRGLKPILAGRNRDEIDALAAELGLTRRVFELGNQAEIARNLDGVAVMLHCAGPFSKTSAPMLAGCLAAN